MNRISITMCAVMCAAAVVAGFVADDFYGRASIVALAGATAAFALTPPRSAESHEERRLRLRRLRDAARAGRCPRCGR